MSYMLAVLIVIAVYACTFVGCNERVDGNAKAGFFVCFAVVAGIIGLFSWLMG